MSIIWFIYGILNEFGFVGKPMYGEESTGYVIALMPCLLIDVIIISIIMKIVEIWK